MKTYSVEYQRKAPSNALFAPSGWYTVELLVRANNAKEAIAKARKRAARGARKFDAVVELAFN